MPPATSRDRGRLVLPGMYAASGSLAPTNDSTVRDAHAPERVPRSQAYPVSAAQDARESRGFRLGGRHVDTGKPRLVPCRRGAEEVLERGPRIPR